MPNYALTLRQQYIPLPNGGLYYLGDEDPRLMLAEQLKKEEQARQTILGLQNLIDRGMQRLTAEGSMQPKDAKKIRDYVDRLKNSKDN